MSDGSWVEGFNTAVGTYLIGREGSWEFGAVPRFDRTPMGAHFVDACSLARVENVDQELESEYVFDSFDANASRSMMMLSAEVSCACGEYTNVRISREADFTDVVRGVATA